MTTPEPSTLLSQSGTRPQTLRDDEFELLCAVAGTNLSASRRERVANCDFSTFEWGKFNALAEHHGVFPLAARKLIEIDAAETTPRLPAEIARSLQSAYETNLRRNLWFASELVRILQHYDSKQLQAIPYKGPVLAQMAYGDLALRRFSDLDLLIRPTDFERGKQALSEIGYHPSNELTAAVERFWLRKGNERVFDGPGGKHLLELQWAILPHFYAVDSQVTDFHPNDLRVENLIRRARRSVLCESEVPCLSAEDSLLVLCLHAAKHLWMRLIWLTDIAETLRSQSAGDPIDHSLVLSRAHALGIVRILAVSFWLVKNLLLDEIPAWAEEAISSDPRVPALGREFAERLARSAAYDFESTEYFRLILRLRERPTDRACYLWRLLWTPGEGDLAAIHLPESLFPLYRLIRVGRLLKRGY